MKSVFVNRGKLLIGLFVMLFSTSVLAESKSSLDPTWVKEDVNWSKYTKFLVHPLVIDRVAVLRPPWAEDDPKEWTLEIEDLQAIQAMFRDAMKEVLTADGGYPLVYAPGDDVLEVEVEILAIMPWIRPGSGNTKDGMQVTTLGTGEITASVEMRDSESRELLLMIAGEKAVGEEYKEFTLENNVANVTNMFTSFAKRLRHAMDKVHGK